MSSNNSPQGANLSPPADSQAVLDSFRENPLREDFCPPPGQILQSPTLGTTVGIPPQERGFLGQITIYWQSAIALVGGILLVLSFLVEEQDRLGVLSVAIFFLFSVSVIVIVGIHETRDLPHRYLIIGPRGILHEFSRGNPQFIPWTSVTCVKRDNNPDALPCDVELCLANGNVHAVNYTYYERRGFPTYEVFLNFIIDFWKKGAAGATIGHPDQDTWVMQKKD